MSSKPPGTVDISTLPTPQLSQLKSQLDTELTHLTTSFQKLSLAQQKFRDCVKSITSLTPPQASSKTPSKPKILVPLTTSLYVPGYLKLKNTTSSQSDGDGEEDDEGEAKVIVDIGTGFYVEKTTSKAKEFYEGKIGELAENLRGLEEVVKQKSGNLRVIEEVLRVKMLAAQQAQREGGGQGEIQGQSQQGAGK